MRPNRDLSGFVLELLDSLETLLGGGLLAAALFGSRARGDHELDSDYDIVVVVADLVAPQAEALINEKWGKRLYGERVALNTTGWSRLTQLAESGDPFSLALIRDAVVLRGQPAVLERLRARYIEGRELGRQQVQEHLRQLVDYYKSRLLAATHDLAASLQAVVMARAQLQCIGSDEADLETTGLLELCKWDMLKSRLEESSVDGLPTELAGRLVSLPKTLIGEVNDDLRTVTSTLVPVLGRDWI